MNKRMGKNILFFIISVVAFAYEFSTFVPDRVVYINGNSNNLTQFVSGIDDENLQSTEKLKLFGILPYKSVAVDVVENDKVIPGGKSIGINLNVDGILILGFSDFYGEDGKKHCPAKEAGLKEKDVITYVNGTEVTSASQFSSMVDSCADSKINLEYVRNGQKATTDIIPVKSAEDGCYRLGLWARDGTSGLGTLTFINPKTNRFAALGHAVTDAETGDVINLGSGNIYYSAVTDVKKGSRGLAGELQGSFISSEIGQIEKNTEFGIYGTFYDEADLEKAVYVASRNEIVCGKATMLCCTVGNTVEEYEIMIEKINPGSYDNKSMIISVTDQNLISKTGGIVQGMSGSPLIQNGKLIGAVTHVFVNDPTRGYGIFIENMLVNTD